MENFVDEHRDDFAGFAKAKSLMWAHESRARVHRAIAETQLLDHDEIMAIHVDNISRLDRVHLTIFDRSGCVRGHDTVFIDELHARLDLTPEFDHAFTKMTVPPNSELAVMIATDDGWVINADVLRRYNLKTDCGCTQRKIFMALLIDLIATGQATGLIKNNVIFDEFDPGDPEEPTHD